MTTKNNSTIVVDDERHLSTDRARVGDSRLVDESEQVTVTITDTDRRQFTCSRTDLSRLLDCLPQDIEIVLDGSPSRNARILRTLLREAHFLLPALTANDRELSLAVEVTQ